MEQHIPLFENAKARLLNAFMDTHESVTTAKIVVRGESYDYPVYNVPLDLLRYNDRNFRIRHQVESHSTATEAESDAWIEDELKKADPETNKSLREGLLRDGQQNPVIVRLCDATAIDGNRRLMTFRALASEAHERFRNIDAAVIADDLSDADWLELEARYQFEPSTKSYYDTINEAKMLRALFEVHGDFARVAERVQQRTRYVEDRINTLDLIDHYLSHIGHPNDYTEMPGGARPAYALFEELAKELRRNTDWNPEALVELERTGFNLITLRKVNNAEAEQDGDDITLDDRTFRRALKAYSEPSAREAMTETFGTGSVLSEQRMSDIRDDAAKDLRQALVIHDALKQAKEPVRMINLAINHLKTVTSIHKDPKVVAALQGVAQELMRIRGLLDGSKAG